MTSEMDNKEKLDQLYEELNKWDNTFHRDTKKRQLLRALDRIEEIWKEIERLESSPKESKGEISGPNDK